MDGIRHSNGSNSSRRKANWTTPGPLPNNWSIVQTLLNQQLGVPYFTRNGGLDILVITRQLLNSRGDTASNDGKPVKARKVDLKPIMADSKTAGRDTWVQINVPPKTEVGIYYITQLVMLTPYNVPKIFVCFYGNRCFITYYVCS